MKKIKAIIIDDENHAIETLCWEIEQNCPEIEVVKKIQKPKEVINQIIDCEFDIMFLDIEMPHLNGFELLKKFPDPDFDVIFTTAYDRFAIDAIKTSALDYLLKPIDSKELINSIKKYKDKKSKIITQESLGSLFHKLGHGFEKIALPSSKGLIFTKPEKIMRCESDSNYTTVFFIDGTKHVISKTLKEIEDILDGHGFLRVHQSHLVNLNHVNQYVKSDGGYIIMDDESSISVSRSKKEDLYRLFS